MQVEKIEHERPRPHRVQDAALRGSGASTSTPRLSLSSAHNQLTYPWSGCAAATVLLDCFHARHTALSVRQRSAADCRVTLAGDDDDCGMFVTQCVAATRDMRDANGHYL